MWLAVLLLAATVSQEGMKALDEQRWDAAVAAFTKAIETEPNDYSHHFHLALALSMLNRDTEAITEYKKVLELKADVPQAQVNLGMVLIRQKRPAEAIPYLEAALKQKPQDFRLNLYLGQALLASGEVVRAEASFTQALAIDPKSEAAEVGLAAARELQGELLLESGKAAEAIPLLEAAVARSPTSANRYALATAYIANKQLEKATPLLEQAVTAEPNNPDLHMAYGRTLREQKKYPAAANEFYKAAQLRPERAEAWSDLAGMLILTENYQQALAALDKVHALGKETAAHHYFRAIVLDKFRQYKPALESYEKFLAMSQGKNPDEEFKARQRIRIIEKELSKR